MNGLTLNWTAVDWGLVDHPEIDKIAKDYACSILNLLPPGSEFAEFVNDGEELTWIFRWPSTAALPTGEQLQHASRKIRSKYNLSVINPYLEMFL